ncbi:hypothetical protein NDU88_001063, partial [Pleurodeles waltl]
WGSGGLLLCGGLLSTSAGGGGWLFLVQASGRGPWVLLSVRPGVDEVLQQPYHGNQGGGEGSDVLPVPPIVFLL